MKPRGRRGGALITALMALMFVFTAGAGLLASSMYSMRRGRFDVLRPKALALADAGVEKALYYLRTTAPDGTTDGSWRTEEYTERVPGFGSFTVAVRNGTGMNAGKIMIHSVGRATDGYEAQANAAPGEPVLANNSGENSITVARSLRITMTLEREEISIWNNAVFGGVGQAGKSINGNVRIRGGVHLLGDGEDYEDLDRDGRWDPAEAFTDSNRNGSYEVGEPFVDLDGDTRRDAGEPFTDINGNGTRDPALTVTDLSSELGGDANIGNNYEGMPSDLRNLLPPLPRVDYRGENVESLKAKLRVKNGQVGLNGSATVGDPNIASAPYEKEPMDGVYVSDGFSGNAGTKNVFSDNGTKQPYNLGDMLRFPSLTDRTTRNGITYSTYMDYLKSSGMVVQGPLTFKPGTSYGPVSDGRGNSLKVDSSGNVEIRGIVYVDGNITFDKDGGNKDMRYTGRGTLVSTGNIAVETNLVPTATFPTQAVMGFIAKGSMSLGTSSQLTLAGAFYAQQKITSTKQNELAGTFVSSYFQMQNVPHMYQVPSLVDNLPPGMPGAERIFVKHVRIDSWREVGNSGSLL